MGTSVHGDANKLQTRLAHFLKMARQQRGWTQKQLADHLGKSLSHVERLESTSNPDNTIIRSILDFRKYAGLLGSSSVDFIAYIEGQEKIDADPLVQKLIDRFRSLDVSVQVELIKLFEQQSGEDLQKLSQIANTIQKLNRTNGKETLASLLQQLAEVIHD